MLDGATSNSRFVPLDSFPLKLASRLPLDPEFQITTIACITSTIALFQSTCIPAAEGFTDAVLESLAISSPTPLVMSKLLGQVWNSFYSIQNPSFHFIREGLTIKFAVLCELTCQLERNN